MLCLFAFQTISSQQTGDYKSVQSGDWTNLSTWNVYNGTSWVAATSYPGQNSGTYNVTVSYGNTVTISNNLSTSTFNRLDVNGVLNLDSTNSQHDITLQTLELNIHGGDLVYTGVKIKVSLPSGGVITIDNNGSVSGSCTNNNEIYIGETKYATCVGSGSNVYTFGDVETNGGNVNTEITTPSNVSTTLCASSLNTPINLVGGYSGTETNVSYEWYSLDPNDNRTLISSGTLAFSSSTTSTTFTPTISGEYLISLEITTSAGATNIEAVDFVIQNAVTAGSISANQEICYGATPNAITSSVNGSGDGTITYEWQTNASGSFQTISDATSATYQPPSLNDDTQYRRRTVSTVNEVACYSGYTQSVIITVDDTTAPLADVASLPTVSGQCSATVTAPTATDNCEGTITGTTTDPTSYSAQGTYTVTWTYDDGNDNISTQTQTVIVDDTTAPTASDITTTIQCNPPAPNVNVITDASDTCGGVTVTFKSESSNGNKCPEIITRIYTVTDSAGNSIDVTHKITIDDTIAPTVTGTLNTISIEGCSDADVPSPVTTIAALESMGVNISDNCTSNSNLLLQFIGDVSKSTTCPDEVERTYRITDSCNNSTDIKQTFYIDDTVNPTASDPEPITVEYGNVPLGIDSITQVDDEADNCTAVPTVTFVSDVSDNNSCLETITRTFKVEDNCGNYIFVTQKIYVEENTAPIARCVNTFTVQIDGNTGMASITPNDIENGSTDNCASTLTKTISKDTFTCSDIGNNTIVLTVEDDYGNTDTCTTTVIVEAPEIDSGTLTGYLDTDVSSNAAQVID
ncbi:MAG TPA: hypothetical protein VJ970_01465, partial [Flavobacteriaceae bacterium]|nr:hypothetical protein [Flavobacteriaceae bacterium]